MPAAAPAVGATPSRVGFELRGRDYTPDSPCQFPGACIRSDAHNWWKHSGQWLDALSARANTPDRRARVARMQKTHEDTNQRDCRTSEATCESAVDVFISTARFSQALANSWGEPVIEVDSDWGWTFPAELPIPDWFGELKAKLRERAIAKMMPLIILGVLFFLSQRKRKGTWL